MDFMIEHNEDSHQFFAVIHGKTAKLDYSILPNGHLDYYSTFVPSELRGQHIGERIVQFALEYARNKQLKIIPSCPFVKSVIQRHPEFKDLVVTSK